MKKIPLISLTASALFASLLCMNTVSVYAADVDYSDGEWVELGKEFANDKGWIDGLMDGLKYVELKKGYKSPIGQAEREKIINSVNARHGYIWVPRKLSTVIGRAEEMLRYAGAVKNSFDIGKIIGIAIGAKSLDDAAELFAEEGMYQGTAFGEAAYWISTISVGLLNGRSFAEAIADGYDEKNIGKWTKVGFKLGEWMANAVNSLPWKKAEREANDKAFRDYLIREGINEKGLKIVDTWLLLSYENRVKVPLKLDPSWFDKKDDSDGGMVCKPGDDPFDSKPETPPDDDGNGQMCPVPNNGNDGSGKQPVRRRRGGGGDTSARIW